MALSSKHRETWDLEIQAWRESVRPVDPQNWLVAVADHLAACESLLREIADHSVGYSSNPMEHVKATFEWAEKARALLGPAE